MESTCWYRGDKECRFERFIFVLEFGGFPNCLDVGKYNSLPLIIFLINQPQCWSISVYTPFHEDGNISQARKAGEAIANASIVIGVVLALTIVLVLLYKFRCYCVSTVILLLPTCSLNLLLILRDCNVVKLVTSYGKVSLDNEWLLLVSCNFKQLQKRSQKKIIWTTQPCIGSGNILEGLCKSWNSSSMLVFAKQCNWLVMDYYFSVKTYNIYRKIVLICLI